MYAVVVVVVFLALDLDRGHLILFYGRGADEKVVGRRADENVVGRRADEKVSAFHRRSDTSTIKQWSLCPTVATSKVLDYWYRSRAYIVANTRKQLLMGRLLKRYRKETGVKNSIVLIFIVSIVRECSCPFPELNL
jgi:hypothetical protein